MTNELIADEGADELERPAERHDARLAEVEGRGVGVQIAPAELDGGRARLFLDVSLRALEHRHGIVVADETHRRLEPARQMYERRAGRAAEVVRTRPRRPELRGQLRDHHPLVGGTHRSMSSKTAATFSSNVKSLACGGLGEQSVPRHGRIIRQLASVYLPMLHFTCAVVDAWGAAGVGAGGRPSAAHPERPWTR
jgi:hypothetical protein